MELTKNRQHSDNCSVNLKSVSQSVGRHNMKRPKNEMHDLSIKSHQDYAQTDNKTHAQ